METAHAFRIHLKTYLQGIKSKSKPNSTPVLVPDVLHIWVAKTFPAWQSIILTTLKTCYEVGNVFFSSESPDGTFFSPLIEVRKRSFKYFF